MTCGVRVRVLFPIEQRLDVVIAPSPSSAHTSYVLMHTRTERETEKEGGGEGEGKKSVARLPSLGGQTPACFDSV